MKAQCNLYKLAKVLDNHVTYVTAFLV